MSFFSFPKDENGAAIVSDKDLAEYMELLLNQLMLLNARFEETFETHIEEDDI